MAKKGLLGKLFTVAAAAAAIGGACYAFRDKIKASKLYEELGIDDKMHSLKELLKKEKDEEDFFEEDEYIFNTEEDDSNRTYVSLHTEASPKEEEKEDTKEEPAAEYTETKDASATEEPEKKDVDESSVETAEETVPTIAIDTLSDIATVSENSFTDTDSTASENSFSDADSTASENSFSDTVSTASEPEGETPTGYDMEGLSDVSEDPDVLMEQDLLDASPFEFY